MKRLVLFLMVIGMTTTVAFSQKTEIRKVSDFTGINASGVFDITVAKGSTESLTIVADDDVMPYVKSEVKNGVLNLYISNERQIKNIKTLKATIVMKNLDNVTLSGACKLTTTDLFTPVNFKADCSGASKMDVNLNTGQLSVEASGAAKIKGDLKASNVTLEASGACVIELTGSATDMKMNASGTAKIYAENFIVKTASVEASGVCNVTVNATDALKINSSGVSSVNYKGSPSLDASNSGMAKVNKI